MAVGGPYFWVYGGKGDISDRHWINGGGYNPSILGATWDTFQGANGGYLSYVEGGATESPDNPGFVRMNNVDSGDYLDAILGVLAFASVGSYPVGRYEVIAVDPSGNWVDLYLTYTFDALGGTCVVGGAYAGDRVNQEEIAFQEFFELGAPGDTMKVRNTVEFDYLSVWIFMGFVTGTVFDHIVAYVCDGDGNKDLSTRVRIFRSLAGVGPVIEYGSPADYLDLWGFEFDGNDLSVYVLDASAGAVFNGFIGCKFHNTIASSIIHYESNQSYWYGCDITDAGGGGHGVSRLGINGILDGCYIHDNSGSGISAVISNGVASFKMINCRVTDNVDSGITMNANSGEWLMLNCFFARNGDDGIQAVGGGTAVDNWVLINTICADNTGYGQMTNTIGSRDSINDMNCAFGNSLGDSDVAWARQGAKTNISINSQQDGDDLARNLDVIQGANHSTQIGLPRPYVPPFDRER